MENDQIKKVISRLEHYYKEAEKLISEESALSLLSTPLKKINSYLVYLEKLIIKLSNSSASNESDKDKLETLFKEQQMIKSKFDSKVNDFLDCNDVTSVEKESMFSAPRTLRSQVSLTITSASSSSKIAEAMAEEQVASLKVVHLEKQLDLERKEIELKHELEMLKAKQKLEEASLHRQVLEEEIDRGGYIEAEPSTSAEIVSRFMNENGSSFVIPSSEAEVPPRIDDVSPLLTNESSLTNEIRPIVSSRPVDHVQFPGVLSYPSTSFKDSDKTYV